jgi:hypothetical protein
MWKSALERFSRRSASDAIDGVISHAADVVETSP